MTTIRQIQRFWDEKRFDRLITELLAARVESAPVVKARLTGSVAASALGLIRMDEVNQAHHPLSQAMLRHILTSQGNDGGWNDPMLCALCVRALLTSRGQGLAIDRGVKFLSNLQKSEGIWPRESLRRMPADAVSSGFVMLQLGSVEAFRSAVRFEDAVAWFDTRIAEIDPDIARLWHHTTLRLRAVSKPASRNPAGDLDQFAIWS